MNTEFNDLSMYLLIIKYFLWRKNVCYLFKYKIQCLVKYNDPGTYLNRFTNNMIWFFFSKYVPVKYPEFHLRVK